MVPSRFASASSACTCSRVLPTNVVSARRGAPKSLHKVPSPDKMVPSRFASASSACTCSRVLYSCPSAAPEPTSVTLIANVLNASLLFMMRPFVNSHVCRRQSRERFNFLHGSTKSLRDGALRGAGKRLFVERMLLVTASDSEMDGPLPKTNCAAL